MSKATNRFEMFASPCLSSRLAICRSQRQIKKEHSPFGLLARAKISREMREAAIKGWDDPAQLLFENGAPVRMKTGHRYVIAGPL